MMPLSDYEIVETLQEGVNASVYRGFLGAKKRPTIFKMLTGDYPSPQKIARFKREYEITAEAKGPGVVAVYGLEYVQNHWVMYLEDFGGQSLDRIYIASQFTMADFLKLAMDITDILEEIHRRQIIHKDINPSNIVFNSDTRQVKLIDFGIATALSQELPAFDHLNTLEGTLAYISPEQTGRMNRAIDYRSDFYSLGATLYALLAGHPPFVADDTLALIHSHIAQKPPALQQVNQNCPALLSQIITKLMAKNAEDRYQTAHGLKADLAVCLERQAAELDQALPSASSTETFQLGAQDISDRLQIPQKLYGRKREIEMLLAAFSRASEGNGEVTLVSGYAGVGKSALVQEVYRPITARRGYFISGKFDQLQRNIPYEPLLQAFRSLMRQLLRETEGAIALWRDKLQAALGNNGRIITDVIPEVELILGAQPAMPELAPIEAQFRFNQVFQNFIRVFTQPAHPLTIFLDDLQWADQASLTLLESLISATNNGYLFLIGAYRDNEVDAAHPLWLTIDKIEKADIPVNRIFLSPLTLSDVTHFMADALPQVTTSLTALAELVLVKTGGNPFFINQFLKSLAAKYLLHFVPPSDDKETTWGWQWDLDQIRMQNITDNVVDLLAGEIRQLPEATQRILRFAACIGNQFDHETLNIACQESVAETATGLWPAIAAGLILPLSESYQWAALDVPGLVDAVTITYKFAHDRIRQAVYDAIPDDEKERIHRNIGLLLLENWSADAQAQQIFDIVNHLNLGRALATQQAERDQLAQLNLQAGQKALASAAYQPAHSYLQMGLAHLQSADDTLWQRAYDLALALHVDGAEAAYLNGDMAQMVQLTQTVLDQARTPLDKVKVHEVRIRAYFAHNQTPKSLETALSILRLLGIELPEKPGKLQILAEIIRTRIALAGKKPEMLLDLPPMPDSTGLAAMRVMTSAFEAALTVRSELIPMLVCKQVQQSLAHGNAPDSAFAYGMFGFIICQMGSIDSGSEFGKLAFQLLEQHDSPRLVAKVNVTVIGLVSHWKTHLNNLLPTLLEAYRSGLEAGDLSFSANGIATYMNISLLTGRNLDTLVQEIENYDTAVEKLNQPAFHNFLKQFGQMMLNLVGQNDDPCLLVGQMYDEEKMAPTHEEAGDTGALFNIHFGKLFLCYYFQSFQLAVDYALKAEAFTQAAASFSGPPLFFYAALARLALCPTLSPAEQKPLLKKVKAHQKKLKKWATFTPDNCLHKYYLIEAELARVLNDRDKAANFYDQAITLADEHNYWNEVALANELAARFYLGQGQEHRARHYVRDAHYGYQRWGATAKVQTLETEFPPIGLNERGRPGSYVHHFYRDWLNRSVGFSQCPQSVSSYCWRNRARQTAGDLDTGGARKCGCGAQSFTAYAG